MSLHRYGVLLLVGLLGHVVEGACAAVEALPATGTVPAQTPLFVSPSMPPLNLLVVGLDQTLFLPAYDDAGDVDGDGIADSHYDPAIAHYGYFDSGKCYRYSSDGQVFVPVEFTGNKVCRSSVGRWSGDFLNYLTTSRADALRRILYGGYRSTDSEDETVLERSQVPQGALAWSKEYAGTADAGFDLADYTPFSAPRGTNRTLFANSSVLVNGATYLHVLPDAPGLRAWDWTGHGPTQHISPIDFVVRVRVCVPALLEGNCKQYPNKHYKPTGLLQEYGEDDQMYFGLMMGAGARDLPGGVLRKAIGSFADEVDAHTGIFGVKGKAGVYSRQAIIASLDGLAAQLPVVCGAANSSCPVGANPLGGIMLDALRYFSGAASPASTDHPAQRSDPYRSDLAHRCSPPVVTVVSDASPSHDSRLPGSPFGALGQAAGTLAQLDVAALGKAIWDHETDGGRRLVSIGEVSSSATDAAPTAKSASSFAELRGLPQEPTGEGSYNAASVAYYGNLTPITTTGLPVTTFAVALSSPLPGIRIPVGDGTVTLTPFGKVVAPGAPSVPAKVSAFFVQSMHNLPGQKPSAQVNGGRPEIAFRAAFEDDVVVLYSVKANADNTLSVSLNTVRAGAGPVLHLGYTMAGTSRDGIYLEVSGGDTLGDPLDTPSGKWAGECRSPASACPLLEANGLPRTFIPDATKQLTPLRNPLWYAAKWGGFDTRRSPLPVDGEWDSRKPGTPDNYFQMADAEHLRAQLTRAFSPILHGHASITAPIVSQQLEGDGFELYSTQLEVGTWGGDLLKRIVPRIGSSKTPRLEWKASERLPRWSERRILMANASGTGLQDFTFEHLAGRRFAGVDLRDHLDVSSVNFLRGDTRHEDLYRQRASLIGDIVNSAPVLGSKASLLVGVAEGLDGGSGSYRAFVAAQDGRDDQVYVGANDGMLHAFNARSGVETFAYVPTPVIPNLHLLTDRRYAREAGRHRFYVDGPPAVADVYFNGGWHRVLVGTLGAGGRGLFALDITDPDAVSLLWEFTTQDDPELGYTLSAPVIARLHSGQWAVLLGNGYGGRDGKASLLLFDIASGQVLTKLTTSDSGANGLSAVSAADVNGDGIADYAYAGDLRGNLWRFDLIDAGAENALSPTSSVSVSRFAVSFGNQPLYHATVSAADPTPQAITAAPAFMKHPSGMGLMVYVGTGRYFTASDKASGTLQSVYGIWDRQTEGGTARSTPSIARTDLLTQTLETESLAGSRRVSQKPIDWTRDAGWLLDLQVGNRLLGERVIAAPKVRGNLLQVVTVTPNADPCSPGLEGHALALSANTGGATLFPVLDLNGDGKVDDQDLVGGTVPSSIPIAAGGVTFSGDSLFDASGKQHKLDLGALSGRQTWTQMPDSAK